MDEEHLINKSHLSQFRRNKVGNLSYFFLVLCRLIPTNMGPNKDNVNHLKVLFESGRRPKRHRRD